jgi:hypothetical protein
MINSAIKAWWNRVKNPKEEIVAPVMAAANPISLKNLRHSLKEALAMARSQLPVMLKHIRGSGTKVTIIHSAGDLAFPEKRMQKIVNSELVDGYIAVEGGHGEIRSEKKSRAYCQLAPYALSAMEKGKGN